jgi:hypothetical protein
MVWRQDKSAWLCGVDGTAVDARWLLVGLFGCSKSCSTGCGGCGGVSEREEGSKLCVIEIEVR